MKVEKKQKGFWLFPVLVALTILALVSIPASAKLNSDEPPPPTPLASQADHIIYLPLVSRITFTDLTVGAIEVTQAVQNLSNTVSLVANRSTVMRVYVQTNTDTPVSGVSVSVSAIRNGSTLPGSPMTLGPRSVSKTWSRADLNSSYNFSLPAAWLSGSVTLRVQVDPGNAISEGDELNNLVNQAANFVSVPGLNVKVVPIFYTDPPSGLTFPASSSSFIAPGLMKMFPISSATVSERAAITWNQNLSLDSSWYSLLSRIATIKSSDNAPASQIYYGLVPLQMPSGYTWFHGGIAGIGYVGHRIAVGLTDASDLFLDGTEIANHEFGHNLGREHAPCNVGDPDPGYPYAGASIGQYGLQISNLKLYNPSAYTDIMSYCDPVWISDYTYQGLFNNQVAAGSVAAVSQAPVESLLVRAALSGDGSIQMEPTYAFAGIPDSLPEESDYTLELLDEQGSLVASYPLPVLHVEEENIRFNSIHAMVPLPGKPYATLRISQKGTPVATRSLAPSGQAPLAEPALQTSEGGSLLSWGAEATPAILRYTADGGETWNTLAVDYLGGQFALEDQALPEGNLHFEIILADQAGTTLNLDWEHTR